MGGGIGSLVGMNRTYAEGGLISLFKKGGEVSASRPHEIASTVLDIDEQDPRIKEYLANGGINMDPVTQAWCAQFVNASLAQAGQKGTGSAAARSFLNYGDPVLSPRVGDIGVFKRRDDDPDPEAKSKGHAGFYMGEEFPGYFDIMGGNQGDAANITQIPTDRLLGFRRPPGSPPDPVVDPFPANLPSGYSMGVSPQERMRPAEGIQTLVGGTMTPNVMQAIQAEQEARHMEQLIARMNMTGI